MKVIFIRHGETEGNILKKYIGKTDEPLCSQGIENVKNRRYPECDILIVSPMKRCMQTADIIYPSKEKLVYDGLKECDFGNFEGKNYIELKDSDEYQKWIDSGGTLAFPGGEAPEEFKKRTNSTFKRIMDKISKKCTVAFVVHGGTIMSVMEKLGVPEKSYYDYMLLNGDYIVTEYDEEKNYYEKSGE